MKNKSLRLVILLGSIFSLGSAPFASANHRSGDFALPSLMAVGDYNRDGNVDLAVNLEGFDNVAIFQGDGQGGFTLRSHIKTDTLPKGLDVGDINSDGKLDLISLDKWGYNIRVNLGDGTGGFTFANDLNGDGEPARIAIADLNKDGKADLVFGALNESKIVIYFGDGEGGFSPSPLELEVSERVYTIVAADFNKDTNLDIAATEFDPDTLDSDFVIFLSDGAGGFSQAGTFATNPQATTLKVADMNKDGNLDVIAAGAGADNDTGLFISTFLGDGHGSFTLKELLDLGTGSIKGEIALADFNEDGSLDVAFPESSKLTIRGDQSTTVLTFFGDGTGNLNAGPDITVEIEPDTAVASDLNKDGHMDLVVSNRTSATVSVLLGNGNGTFTTHATIPVAAIP